MAKPYTIYGSEMSPYSHKVRSWFRYKQIDHLWIPGGPGSQDPEYRRLARLPIVPLVVYPDGGTALQDSTPIIEKLEAEFPEPGIGPPGTLLSFLSTLMEEFGDEWGNKLMFHLRWYADVDMSASSLRAARLTLPKGTENEVKERAEVVRERMSGRGHFVGSSDRTAPLIATYYVELLDVLQQHLEKRKYLFGARPAFADFALAAQLYHASADPTGGSIMRARALNVLDWCFRMMEPRNDGPFEEWVELEGTMKPLLDYIGRLFLPWTNANAIALTAGVDEFTVVLDGKAYVQPPQRYHAKSLGVLRQKYSEVADDSPLRDLLFEANCLEFLQPKS
ncbi:MAG TPA: glutathione S-transferase family protein [Candidatus Aquiluna sp.]|nr:glutathione S-transferase family protein [Aquiluna sp.]